MEQNPCRWRSVRKFQIVVETREFEVSDELTIDYLGADASSSHQQALIDEFLDRTAYRRSGDPELLDQSHFILDPGARRQFTAFDGFAHAFCDLVVQGDRAGSV